MKIMDQRLKDGVHEWRDGKWLVKEGFKLYLEGTDTLAGSRLSVVTLWMPASGGRAAAAPSAAFRRCSLGEAITVNARRSIRRDASD